MSFRNLPPCARGTGYDNNVENALFKKKRHGPGLDINIAGSGDSIEGDLAEGIRRRDLASKKRRFSKTARAGGSGEVDSRRHQRGMDVIEDIEFDARIAVGNLVSGYFDTMVFRFFPECIKCRLWNGSGFKKSPVRGIGDHADSALAAFLSHPDFASAVMRETSQFHAGGCQVLEGGQWALDQKEAFRLAGCH